MNPLLIEPTDVLFFRDAIPMSAGQGSGSGARMPLPSTFHEAIRASLLLANGVKSCGKNVPGRPTKSARTGDWRQGNESTDRFIATKAFRSLQCVGPFPWDENKGLLLPVPLDVAFERDPGKSADTPRTRLRQMKLSRDESISPETASKYKVAL